MISRFIFIGALVLTLSVQAQEPKTKAVPMSDFEIDTPLSPKGLQGASYSATLALRGGEEIYKGRQLDAYLVLARAVFESAVQSANRSEMREDKKDYLHAARDTAYNIASNTWPGWNEGEITEEQRLLGLKFSKISLEIAQQINMRSPGAPWMAGVHELAAKNYKEARSLFGKARSLSEEEGSEEAVLMNAGWILVVDVLEGKSDAEAELEQLKERLTALGDDGKFYASQYDDALSVFRR